MNHAARPPCFDGSKADMDFLVVILQSGMGSLVSYLAAHVLLCLVPAFFVAGALSALVPQASVVRFLGPGASKWVAYPAAAGAGSLLAVCSCTVQPLFAGIYKQGAGLGPAMTFMFFAPAANILALSYTGVALGGEFALARLVLSLVFGVGIGMIMAVLFHRDDMARTAQIESFQDNAGVSCMTFVFLLALVALLIGGTLKVTPLTAQLWSADLTWPWASKAQTTLDLWLPMDALRGEEGLSLQGTVLIGLLGLIGMTSLRGLGKVDEGFNKLTWTSLSLIALTLIFAAVGINATAEGLHVALTGRTVVVATLLAALVPLASRFDAWDIQQWLWETWRFVKQIFPLLVAGVFIVGVIRVFIEPAWVQTVAGSNTLLGNMAGVVFGVFMYFPTLVEVPVAKMLLSMGMHPGPLLAYIMADPELSVQSMLITASIIGRRKTAIYVALVAFFATVAGLAYGAWVDARPVWHIALSVAALCFAVTATVRIFGRRQLQEPVGTA